jgi:hypothetical protein
MTQPQRARIAVVWQWAFGQTATPEREYLTRPKHLAAHLLLRAVSGQVGD